MYTVLLPKIAVEFYLRPSLPLKVRSRRWTQSVQGAVATWSTIGSRIVRKYRMVFADQVATAPCTDCVQAWFGFLRQSYSEQSKGSRSQTGRAEIEFVCFLAYRVVVIKNIDSEVGSEIRIGDTYAQADRATKNVIGPG